MNHTFSLFQSMERDKIILSFKGDITQDLLASVYQIMESRMDQDKTDSKRKKRFYHILVECLQNVYHHMEDFRNVSEVTEISDGSAIFIIAKAKGEGYRIITGNYIKKEESEDLKSKLEKINSMNTDELRTYYLETLSTTELSQKGGAGLGMIDIARKSGHKIVYSFDGVTDTVSFFTLEVTIN